jgi:hypothetical protein
MFHTLWVCLAKGKGLLCTGTFDDLLPEGQVEWRWVTSIQTWGSFSAAHKSGCAPGRTPTLNYSYLWMLVRSYASENWERDNIHV